MCFISKCLLFAPTFASTKHFHRFPSGGSTRWFLGWRSQVSRTTGRRLGENHSSFVDTYSPLQFILDFLALPIMHKYNRGKWNVKKLNMNKNTNIIFSPGNVVLTETCYFRYHHFNFQQLDLQLNFRLCSWRILRSRTTSESRTGSWGRGSSGSWRSWRRPLTTPRAMVGLPPTSCQGE